MAVPVPAKGRASDDRRVPVPAGEAYPGPAGSRVRLASFGRWRHGGPSGRGRGRGSREKLPSPIAITGVTSGDPATPRSSDEPPKLPFATTIDGLRMVQGTELCRRSASPRSLVAGKGVDVFPCAADGRDEDDSERCRRGCCGSVECLWTRDVHAFEVGARELSRGKLTITSTPARRDATSLGSDSIRSRRIASALGKVRATIAGLRAAAVTR